MMDFLKTLQQAKEIKKQLDGVQVVGVSKNQKIKITMSGSHELLGVETGDPVEFQDKNDLEKSISEAIKEALEALKRKMVESFKDRVAM